MNSSIVGLMILLLSCSFSFSMAEELPGFGMGIVKEAVVLMVPKDYPTVAGAVHAAGDLDAEEIEIKIKPGFYSEQISIYGSQFEGKKIRLVGKVSPKAVRKFKKGLTTDQFAGRVVIWNAMSRNTVLVNVPGQMNLEIENCVLINSHFLDLNDESGYRWNYAVVQVAWNASVKMINNLVISSHGHGISMSFVDVAHFEDNTIVAPRIGILDHNNNFAADKRISKGNTFISTKIGHYYDNAIEAPSDDEYIGTGETIVFLSNYDLYFWDSEIADEFREELLN